MVIRELMEIYDGVVMENQMERHRWILVYNRSGYRFCGMSMATTWLHDKQKNALRVWRLQTPASAMNSGVGDKPMIHKPGFMEPDHATISPRQFLDTYT